MPSMATHSAALPGLHTPGAGFDQPFDMLSACHDRVRRSLNLLQRLVDHVEQHGTDAQARDAAADVLRYFTLAAPAHHEDEERHVVPRLLGSSDTRAQAAAQQMLADHHLIRQHWNELEPLLRHASQGQAVPLAALKRAASAFIGVHDAHLSLEDDYAFPHGRGLVEAEGEQEVAAMGREMAARRGQRL